MPGIEINNDRRLAEIALIQNYGFGFVDRHIIYRFAR